MFNKIPFTELFRHVSVHESVFINIWKCNFNVEHASVIAVYVILHSIRVLLIFTSYMSVIVLHAIHVSTLHHDFVHHRPRIHDIC